MIFHVQSLQHLPKLPFKCYNCTNKVSTATGKKSDPISNTKTIITLQKGDMTSKKTIPSSASTMTAPVSLASITSTFSAAKMPFSGSLRTLNYVTTQRNQETKESGRYAFNGPPTSDSITHRGQFKCHICKKLIKIQPNEIKNHFIKEHKNIEIHTLTPLLKKLDIENSQKSNESLTFIKAEPEDEANIEDPLSVPTDVHTERSTEVSEPPKKKKKLKLSSKEKPSTPTTPFSSGKLIFPIIKKEDNRFECFKCGFTHTDKTEFEKHVLGHKTDSSSFQCMECGMCFIVQPSFEKHLFVCHGIKDVEEYVRENQNCKEDSYDPYNGYSPVSVSSDEDADDNKCSVCHESFQTSEELDKHFRVHGMAFLLKKQRELRQIITS